MFIVSLQSSFVNYYQNLSKQKAIIIRKARFMRFELQILKDIYDVLYLKKENWSTEMFYINSLYFLKQTWS